MFKKLLVTVLLLGISTKIGTSQPKNKAELPNEIKKYLTKNFKSYSFSKDLLENERRTHDNELTNHFLNQPIQSHYYLEGDFNSDGKNDYLLNLYKTEKLSNSNSKYSKLIEVRAVLIYSTDSKYVHYTEGLPLGRGAVREIENVKPKARSHFAITEPGTYDAMDLRNGGTEEVVIQHPSIVIIGGSNLLVITWNGEEFTSHQIYTSI